MKIINEKDVGSYVGAYISKVVKAWQEGEAIYWEWIMQRTKDGVVVSLGNVDNKVEFWPREIIEMLIEEGW